MKISELVGGMKRVEVTAKIVNVSPPRQVKSRFGDATYNVADATLQDSSGAIKLSLWDEAVDSVKVGDIVQIENAYTTVFKGEVQLNVGKFGKLATI